MLCTTFCLQREKIASVNILFYISTKIQIMKNLERYAHTFEKDKKLVTSPIPFLGCHGQNDYNHCIVEYGWVTG